MSDNIKNANQRLKILYLYKILLERTDEEHYITMPEIISQLELYAERHIASRQIGRDLRGHHSGVGACHIQVNIKVRRQ